MARGNISASESADATSISRAIGARDEALAQQERASIKGGGAQVNNTFGGPSQKRLSSTPYGSGISKSDSQQMVPKGNNLAANRAGSNRVGGPGSSSTNRARGSGGGRSVSRGGGITGAVSPLGTGGAGGGKRRGR